MCIVRITDNNSIGLKVSLKMIGIERRAEMAIRPSRDP